MNRLGRETSPYLLQHRNNPVEWFAWGAEAFAEARRRDVPIFLSVGYSTCYWCHVMERESFESEEIARLMNASFVCVKVDREERPDVDEVYMAAVQAFTHRGGWPMSVFLEPATLRPFWAGTYFPDKAKFLGVPTFPQVLESIAEAWKAKRAEVLEQSRTLAEAVRERVSHASTPVRVGQAQVAEAASQLLRLHDPVHGGFGRAPKFPQPSFLDLLLEVRRAAGDDQTRSAVDGAVRNTLTKMALGGMFDQVGGGFHRYSVDEQWLVPHFEKMLYDNGQLAETYARAAHVYDSPLYARTARRICEYVLREMVSPEGAFYSAQDAEVNHREGQNYLWTRSQMIEALGATDGEWASGVYGLDGGPNFRDPHHADDPPANVLFLAEEVDWGRLDRVNQRLYEVRGKRDQPRTDTKIITAWNGLMIAGLAHAGSALREPRFIDAARRAADWVLSATRSGLTRTVGTGAAIPAFLEDYALFTHGLLALHRSLGEGKSPYMAAAVRLTADAERLFGDGTGALFDSRADQRDLFVRARSVHDGAMPSGSSVMMNNFVDLAELTGEAAYRAKAGAALAAISGAIAEHPLGAPNAVRALLRLLTMDRGAVESALAHAEPAPRGRGAEPADEVVEIMSAVDQVAVGAEPVGIVLRIKIAEGFHVTAAEPGEGLVGLAPFAVTIVGGTGVRVYADYPTGEPIAAQENMLAYSGEFDLPIVLEREAEITGTPLIAVRYQACTDRACLAARTVELDIVIGESAGGGHD